MKYSSHAEQCSTDLSMMGFAIHVCVLLPLWQFHNAVVRSVRSKRGFDVVVLISCLGISQGFLGPALPVRDYPKDLFRLSLKAATELLETEEEVAISLKELRRYHQ